MENGTLKIMCQRNEQKHPSADYVHDAYHVVVIKKQRSDYQNHLYDEQYMAPKILLCVPAQAMNMHIHDLYITFSAITQLLFH